MAQNALTGTIPNLSLMKDLRNLLLYHNKFTGTIPTTLFSLTNLGKNVKKAFALNNLIRQILTIKLIHPVFAEILFLSSNQLTSSVPGEIVNLQSTLRGLYLSDNLFEGEIPTALCELQHLGESLA